ncbi:MAG: hypothetical protein RL277_2724 [Planctomycetota bacterium]|jgi:Zn-dependent protease with chaperone function
MPALLPLLFAFLALALADEGLRSNEEQLWVMPLLAVLPHLIGWRVRAAMVLGRFRRATLLLKLLTWLPTAGHACCVLLLGYSAALERWMDRPIGLAWWPDLWLMVAIAPWLVLELLTIDARARLQYRMFDHRAREHVARQRRWQLRSLLGLLAPLTAFLTVSTLVGLNEELRVRIEHVGLYASAYGAALVIGFAALLPWLLTQAWDTRAIPSGPLRDIFDTVAKHADFRARAVYAWNTEGSMANAAIVGLGSRLRVVLFSDALLNQLNGQELAAVYAHEIAHAKRGHVLLFGLWALAAFLGGDLLGQHFFADDPWLQSGCVLGGLGLWFLFFGWLSRRCELEADLFSMRLIGTHEPIISALERVGGRLRDVAGWRHFSIAQRVAFLESVNADPEVGERLERTLRRFFATGLLLALLTGGLFLARDAIRLPNELVMSDLIVGSYRSAAERVDSGPEVDALHQELVRVARTLPEDRLSAAAIEQLALERAQAGAVLGDVQTLLLLGALRGDDQLRTLAFWLSDPSVEPAEPYRARWAALVR